MRAGFHILESWLDYIKEEEKLPLEIDTKYIGEEQKFNIELIGKHISIDKKIKDNNIANLLKEKIKEKLNKKEESLEYSLMFFPLKFKSSENDLDKETGKVYPLAFISQTLSLKDLKEENIKEFVERHIESLTVDISSSSSPIVLATVNLA
ncbi:MAG: hypothetical protein ACP5QP_08230, partial [Brevinematia bacterium]